MAITHTWRSDLFADEMLAGQSCGTITNGNRARRERRGRTRSLGNADRERSSSRDSDHCRTRWSVFFWRSSGGRRSCVDWITWVRDLPLGNIALGAGEKLQLRAICMQISATHTTVNVVVTQKQGGWS